MDNLHLYRNDKTNDPTRPRPYVSLTCFLELLALGSLSTTNNKQQQQLDLRRINKEDISDMSGYPYESDYPSSPRRQLAGAARPSANPRIHAIQKPYSRPNSYAGPSGSSPLGKELVPANGNGHGYGNVSPTKASAPTTRPTLPTSQSQGGARSFPRSGSESSLFGSLRGLISKPLSWLATPRSTSKRDQSTWNAGLDSEDPESPSVKKLRRNSPPRTRGGATAPGVYDPPQQQTRGKGKEREREMLPPLPDIAGGLRKLPTTRALGGSSLPHSQSMPYLDPPSDVFSPAKKRLGGGAGGAITRSRGMNLAALANDEEPESAPAPQQKEKDVWSPWKQQPASRGQTPVKRGNRSSISEVRDVSLPWSLPASGPKLIIVSTTSPRFHLSVRRPRRQ